MTPAAITFAFWVLGLGFVRVFLLIAFTGLVLESQGIPGPKALRKAIRRHRKRAQKRKRQART